MVLLKRVALPAALLLGVLAFAPRPARADDFQTHVDKAKSILTQLDQVFANAQARLGQEWTAYNSGGRSETVQTSAGSGDSASAGNASKKASNKSNGRGKGTKKKKKPNNAF